jgi:hypothetical protein
MALKLSDQHAALQASMSPMCVSLHVFGKRGFMSLHAQDGCDVRVMQRATLLLVIPAQAGIQLNMARSTQDFFVACYAPHSSLDSGLRRNDDSL